MKIRPRLRPVVPALAAMLLGATALAPAARAEMAPVSAEQAKTVDADIRAWLGGLIGAAVDVGQLPLRVIAEADSYQLEVPFGGEVADGAVKVGHGTITVRVKQLDDHRWAVEGFRMPSPMTFGMNKALAKKEGMKPAGATIRIGDQDTKGVIDTSLATASTLDTRIQGYTVEIQGKDGPQHTRVDGLASHIAWTPAGNGLLAVTGHSTLDGYRSTMTLEGGMPVKLDAAHMRSAIDAKGVAPADLRTAIESIATLIGRAKAASGRPLGATPEDKETAKTLVKALAGVFSNLKADVAYEGLRVDVAGQTGGLDKLAIGFDMGAPEGRARLAWRIGLDGFTPPAAMPQVFRAYVPKQLRLTPFVGGIEKQALVAAVLHAIDHPEQSDNFMPVLIGLLQKGPLVAGVKDIAFDLGPATLAGGGAVKVVSPAEYTGAAEFRATGLDELITRANNTPQLKQAAPMLVFLKGIGHQDGKVTVWKIRYAGHKLMVNGNDMSKMVKNFE